MKKNLLFILLILLGKIAISQQNYFSKKYDIEKYNTCSSILPYENKYFILIPTKDSLLDAHFNIGQIDSAGNFLWYKHYQEPSPVSWLVGVQGSLEFYDDSTLFFAGAFNHNNAHALLNKFNLQGDTLWRKVFGDTAYFQNGWQAKKTRDGGFAIVINTNEYSSNGVDLIRTDNLGNELWTKHYGGSQESIAISLDTTIDGGFIMAGGTLSLGVPVGSRCPQLYCIKADSLGNMQWQKSYGGQYGDEAWSVIQCKDSSIVIAGYHSTYDPSDPFFCDAGIFAPYVIKIDQQGDTLWERTFGESKFNTTIRKIRELHDGSLIATGQIARDSTFKSISFIVKIASNGDSLWYHTYAHLQGIWSINELYDIMPTNDGGFIACGSILAHAPDTVEGKQYAWILKIDSNGCEVSNCLINSTSNFPRELNKLLIFPIPSSGIFYINKLEELTPVYWTIIDVFGKIILSGKELPEVFNLESFNSGIYFYKIEMKDNQVFSGKLIKN